MSRFRFEAVVFAAFLSVLVGCAKDFEIVKVRLVDESNRTGHSSLEQLFAERVVIKTSGSDKSLAAGYDCLRQELWGSSRVLIENHLVEKPSDWRGYYILALLAIVDMDHERAEKYLQTALRLSTPETRQRAIVYLALGQVLESQGKPGLSQQHYLIALNLDSSLSAARDGIGRLTPLMSVEPR